MWVDGRLITADQSVDQIVQRLRCIAAERLDRVLKSAEGSIVLDVNVTPAEAELMVAPQIIEVFVKLKEILRSAERNGAAGIKG